MMRATAVVVLGGASVVGQLVAPGGLVPAGGTGGPVGRRRGGGGWGVVDKWPVGFFVGGSGLGGMNGVYVRADAVDHGLPHYCELTWGNVDGDWKLASAHVDGWDGVDGADKEWLVIDGEGRDVLASPGKHYLPSGARSWRVVRREFRYWAPGDVAATREDVAGFWNAGERGKVVAVDGPDPDVPIVWRRFRDGRTYTLGAWRLRRADGGDGGAVVTGDEDEDWVRPWQIVGIMSRSRLDELLDQKRRYDDDVKAARRRGGGGLAVAAATWAPPDDGDDDEEAAAAHVGECAENATAASARRAGDLDAALDLAERAAAADPRRHLLELAKARLDRDEPCAAVAALDALYALRREAPGLGTWLLRAHARARNAPCCAPVGATDFCVGDAVATTDRLDGFWDAGERATVVGVASPAAPVALKMATSGRLIDVQPDRIVRAPAEPPRVAGGGDDDRFDPYVALRVPCDFAPDDLRRAYRTASKASHPDRHGGSDDKFRNVARAYDVLSDADAKRRWDAGLDIPGDRPQMFSLEEELTMHYFPELVPFQPFGDPLENKRDQDARDAAAATKKARRSWW